MLLLVFLVAKGKPYNHSSINAHDEVEPRLDRKLEVCISQHLESKQPLLMLLLPRVVAVEARHETVERVEHRRCGPAGDAMWLFMPFSGLEILGSQ